MNDALHAAASGMSTVARMVDASARNAMNADSAGYLSEMLVSRSFRTVIDQELGREAALVESASRISFQPGTFVQEDSATAVALDGPGFLVVRTQAGPHYTRNGDLTIDASGTLITRAGYPVYGQGGPIQADPAGLEPSIEADGRVMQGDQEIGRLELVEFDRRDLLERNGDTLFSAPPAAGMRPATDTQLVPRMLEMPAERSIHSMVSMIAANRTYEAAQRAIRMIAGSYEQLVRNQR